MRKFSEFIADAARIPKDVAMNLPRVSICGDREMYIENHKGLAQYTEESVRIKMNDGIMNISGTGLKITVMESDRILIEDIFDTVSYEKIGRNLKNVKKNL